MPKYAPVGYCDSKFMNAMFSRELANRFPDVKVICVGPGWCKTELARNVEIPWYKKVLFAPIAFMFMRSSSQGAQNIIHAVVEDNDKLEVRITFCKIICLNTFIGRSFFRVDISTETLRKLKRKTRKWMQIWQTSLNGFGQCRTMPPNDSTFKVSLFLASPSWSDITIM